MINERFLRDFFRMGAEPKPQAQPRCSSCRFFELANDFGGPCKRHAPSPIKQERGGYWPWVSHADWCGDHEPKDAS